MIGARFKTDFNAKPVLDRVETGTRRALLREGGYTKTVARRSMRRRKKASPPGQPPSAHRGTLKEHLFAVLDTNGRVSVVVGPSLEWGNSRGLKTVPEVLEEGGESVRKGEARELKIGSGGIMEVGKGPHTKSVRGVGGQRFKVRFARIRTESQLARAQAFEYQVFGTKKARKVNIAARPYMAPALQAAMAKHADFWTDSVK